MKKLPLLFTLALATVTVTGCDAFSFINGGTTPEPGSGESTPSGFQEGDKDKDPSEEDVWIEDILLPETEAIINVGQTYQIDYEVWPRGAYSEVSFSSANTDVASVTPNGLVQGLAEGSSEITLISYQDTSVTAKFTINVNPASETSFNVTFDPNGGSGSMASKTTSGTSYITPECTFTYASHSFKEWALNSTSGIKYNAGATITGISSNITLYAIWQKSSSDYYAACEGLSGSSLQAKLKDINPPKSPSYDWSRYEAADEAEDDSTCILSIYTRHNIKKSSHCGDYAWDKWNREHVWTDSAHPASNKDNHNIFACEGQINNYRGNLPFAEGGSVVTVFGHTTGCKMISGTSFEPCDEAKGEIARSVMYGTVMYSYTMTDEIDSIYLALKWHLEHPITTRETKRNDTVYGLQGNRNMFVDHPEYACKIWGNTNSQTKSICGM